MSFADQSIHQMRSHSSPPIRFPVQPEYQGVASINNNADVLATLRHSQAKDAPAGMASSLRIQPELAETVLKAYSQETSSVPPAILRVDSRYRARTDLGQRLRKIRLRIVASGIRLLSWDEIEKEIAERREDSRATDQ